MCQSLIVIYSRMYLCRNGLPLSVRLAKLLLNETHLHSLNNLFNARFEGFFRLTESIKRETETT